MVLLLMMVFLILQKKTIRILTFHASEHCRTLFIETGILTMINLCIFDIVYIVRKNIDSFKTRSEFHEHNTRFKNKIDVMRCRLTRTQKCHHSLVLKIYNKLPSKLVNILPVTRLFP
jgi:hypothetical protein